MGLSQWTGKNMNVAYARELARLLGMPLVLPGGQPTIVSTVIASTTMDETQEARALQSNGMMGTGTVTIGSLVTTTAMGKVLAEQMLQGTTAETREMAAFGVRLGVGTVVCMNFIVQSTPMPSAPPTMRPSPVPTASRAAAGLSAASAVSGGLPTTSIIGIVVALLVVLGVAMYVIYTYMCHSKAQPKPSVAAQWNASSGGPSFQPHIARGMQAQRYSGSSRGSMGRQSIELADYRIGYGNGDDGASIQSENPHFGNNRLSFARGQSFSRGGPGSPKYLFSDKASLGGNPMHSAKGPKISGKI